MTSSSGSFADGPDVGVWSAHSRTAAISTYTAASRTAGGDALCRLGIPLRPFGPATSGLRGRRAYLQGVQQRLTLPLTRPAARRDTSMPVCSSSAETLAGP